MRKLVQSLPVWLAVIASCAVLVLRVPQGVETDLYGLADARHGGVLQEIAQGMAGQGRVLLEGDDFESLEAVAAKIAEKFGQKPAGDLRTTLRTLEAHASGFLAPSTRTLLQEGKYKEVATSSAARLFGLAPPLFSVKGDPFLLATGWAESLQTNLAEGWSLRGGCPVHEQDGRFYLLMTLDLSRVAAPRIVDFLDHCTVRNSESGGVKIWCGGAPFHSARASERSKREVGMLSAISLVVVFALGWLLFRSVRFVPELLVAQGVGFLVAAGTLFAVFPRPHVLTLVFGTSLIGLSVDYVYHARAAGGARRILRPLTLSLATTLTCFAPLCFAEICVLRQMAVFTMAGLLAVFGVVVLWKMPEGCEWTMNDTRGVVPQGGRWRIVCVCVVLFICAVGLWRMQIVNDPAAFYKPDAELLESERKLMELSPGQANRFAFVSGETLQEALENEETAGVRGLSAVIPSLKRQRENAELIARLVSAEGSNYTAMTGLKMPRSANGFLDPEQLTEGPLAQMVRAMRVKGGLISPFPSSTPRSQCLKPNPQSPIPNPQHLTILEPRVALQDLFRTFTHSALRLLVVSFVVFAVLLVVLLRRACLRIAAPVVSALIVTGGVLGWLNVPVTFFTLLCFFVLVGLGIDYSIFHASNPAPETRRTVLFSFLTSFTGLGLLAFTEFPVTRSMGLTFAIGLAFAYLLSRLQSSLFNFQSSVFSITPYAKTPNPEGSPLRASAPPRENSPLLNPQSPTPNPQSSTLWHEQQEQSAGRLRMLFMWWVYRLLGKNALKICCIPVMVFIYPFAKPAKRALRVFYRILSESNTQTPNPNTPLSCSSAPPRLRVSSSPTTGPDPQPPTPNTPSLFRHLLGFAWSLVDKTDACTLRKNLPKMSVVDDAEWHDFQELISQQKGCFLISTHLGTIEVLPALATKVETPPRVHAFQQMGHDAVFTKVFTKHFDACAFTLHAVEEIGVETAVEMQAAITRGELVLMAGDRVSAGSGKTLAHDFFGHSCRWPKGVFTFAKLMEAPVFFVTCVRTGWNAYTCRFRHFDETGSGNVVSRMLDQYAGFLEEETRRYPDQWYQFYDFFGA